MRFFMAGSSVCPNANVIPLLVIQSVSVVATDIPSFAPFIRDLAWDYARLPGHIVVWVVIGRAAPNGAGRRNVGVDIRIPLAGRLGWNLRASEYREKEQSY